MRADERTLREVYLPHFKKAVDAGVAAIMSSYNKVNGDYAAENEWLLRKVLKDEWGFRGFVMSDFFYGVYDGPKAAKAGLDVEMPLADKYGPDFIRAVEKGSVSASLVDDAVRRILRRKVFYATRHDPRAYDASLVVSAEHVALAREVAEKSMVLLKNDGPLLPLDKGVVEDARRARSAGRSREPGRPRQQPGLPAPRRHPAPGPAGVRRRQGADRPRAGSRPGARARRRPGRPTRWWWWSASITPTRASRSPRSPRGERGGDRRSLALHPDEHAAREGGGGREQEGGGRARRRERHHDGGVEAGRARDPDGLVPGHGGGPRAGPHPLRRREPVGQADPHGSRRRLLAAAVRPRGQRASSTATSTATPWPTRRASSLRSRSVSA